MVKKVPKEILEKMNEQTREEVLRIEEIKAIKLFTVLFYFVYIAYDLIYYYLVPYIKHEEVGFPEKGLGYLMYIIILLLLPFVYYLIKKERPFLIKYIYFYAFLLLDFCNNILIYWGTDTPYITGNFVELLFLIFSPIFVNRRYFGIITVSMILKYVAYGVLFQSVDTLVPVMLVFLLAIFGWILLARFTSYINGMILAYEDAKQKEKLAAVGQMAASIAHEIRNPLSALKGFTQLQLEKDKDDENFYPIMLNEIDRINLIVSDLLILGKPNVATKSHVSLKEILNYVVSIIEPQSYRQLITIRIEIGASLPYIYCDENQLKQVFLNLIKNSVESMVGGGNIYIKAKFKNNHFIISIQDEGEGIPQEQIEKLGEPFYTTKPNGTGLGLMVTKKIVEEHKGKLEITSTPNKGTTINVILPK